VSHNNIDGLHCYGSSKDKEVQAQTSVQAAVQPGIEITEMASLAAAAARVIICLSLSICT
jgi:hypothetical protein